MIKFAQSFMVLGACLLISDTAAAWEPETPADPPAIEVVPNKFPDVSMTAGELAGLYKNAGANSPIALIIPGSGPTDLNGNNAIGGKNNAYKYLAEGLAEKGISSVRVDKRGMFSSAAAGNPNQVSVEIYAKDYSDWIDAIRAETGAKCVYILGHSEGAMMGSAAAVVNDNVCGLILVGGMGRPMGVILREQLKANPANRPILKEAFEIIDKLERGERVHTSNMHRALRRSLFAAEVQDHMISTMKLHPARLAAAANKRTLIIHGETDIQTSVKDAKALAEATSGKLVIVPGVNHILKEAPKNRAKNLKTYSNPDLPISPEVVAAIVEFAEKQ